MRSDNDQGGQKKRTFIEEARRAQIIEAVVEVTSEHGYSNASLARIARHAGISKGVISYHFAGKDELVDEAVKTIFVAIAESVGPLIQAEPDARAALRTHVVSVGQWVQRHPVEMNALTEIFNGARLPDGKARYGYARAVDLYKGHELLFQWGQEEGVFRHFDKRVMAITLQTALDAAFGYKATFPEYDLDAHMIELAELLDRATRAD